MAKKKVTHGSNEPKQEKAQHQTLSHHQEPPSSMEDPKEKLQNLRSLNSFLLKETMEKRHQVESLTQAKVDLEAELTRCGVLRTQLEAELTRASEESVSLEMQKGVFCVFIETQMRDFGGGVVDMLVREKREKESQIEVLKSEVNELMLKFESERESLSRVSRDRDFLRSDIENWIAEANVLKEKIIEVERRERKSEEENGKLKMRCDNLIKQNNERKKDIVEVKRLRDLAEKNLEEKVKEIEDLKKKNEGIVREKNEVEVERGEQKVKICELETKVSELNEIVLTLQKEEGDLREKVLELENSCGEVMEKEKGMAMEIEGLVVEKRDMDRTIQRLMEENHSREQFIKNAKMELEHEQGRIEGLLREKKEIEEVKASKDSEIEELDKEVGRLRDVVFSTQQSLVDEEEKNKQLASDVSHYSDAFLQARLEKENAQKSLEEEKKNGRNLGSKVLGMEKKIKENIQEFAKMKSEFDSLIKERKEMESQLNLVKKEKDLVQGNLLEARQEIDDLRTKLESAGINSERALTMLRNTAASMRLSNNEKEKAFVNEEVLEDGIELYATELEAIKNAFGDKEKVVEEMTQQLGFLQNAVVKARKTNVWTIVSSATTVLALCLAFVAKLR